jgi:hypothetical protein
VLEPCRIGRFSSRSVDRSARRPLRPSPVPEARFQGPRARAAVGAAGAVPGGRRHLRLPRAARDFLLKRGHRVRREGAFAAAGHLPCQSLVALPHPCASLLAGARQAAPQRRTHPRRAGTAHARRPGVAPAGPERAVQPEGRGGEGRARAAAGRGLQCLAGRGPRRPGERAGVRGRRSPRGRGGRGGAGGVQTAGTVEHACALGQSCRLFRTEQTSIFQPATRNKTPPHHAAQVFFLPTPMAVKARLVSTGNNICFTRRARHDVAQSFGCAQATACTHWVHHAAVPQNASLALAHFPAPPGAGAGWESRPTSLTRRGSRPSSAPCGCR